MKEVTNGNTIDFGTLKLTHRVSLAGNWRTPY